MANPEHVAKLKEGVEAWNQWRKENEGLRPDLSGLDFKKNGFSSEHFAGGNFRDTNFSNTTFYEIEIRGADFTFADFCGAQFVSSGFYNSSVLESAKFQAVHMGDYFQIEDCKCNNADFSLSRFQEASFSNSSFRQADFRGTRFKWSGFTDKCDLTQATFNTVFYWTNFFDVDMSGVLLNIPIDDYISFLRSNNQLCEAIDERVEELSKSQRNTSFSEVYFSKVNLASANLESLPLNSISFRGCDFTRANLKRVDLSGTDLEEVSSPFHDSNLKDAAFEGAIFSPTNETHKINPKDIDFSGADLRGVDFKDQGIIDLSSAKLAETNLSNVDLSGLNLSDADLSGAKLENAQLKDAQLYDANLSGADVRKSIGLRLDANYIRDTRFASYAQDPWSILRRNYTGANFILNLLALFIFAIPFVIKTTLWAVVNRMQSALAESTGALESASLRLQQQDNPLALELGTIAENLSQIQSCLAPECRDWYVVQLLLGVDQGFFYWSFTLALVVYSGLRGLLTWVVGPLRDEEERSNYAPSFRRVVDANSSVTWSRPISWFRFTSEKVLARRQSYGWLFPLHRWVQRLFWIGVAFFVLFTFPQLLRLLFSEVALPVN